MKKQQVKNSFILSVINLDLLKSGVEVEKTKKAFTLVELIIVITILAVLATIAFVSFSSYTTSSRDTKRIVTIESISKGLNIFQTQTGKYPNIDNQSSAGIINSDTLSFVGEVGDNVSRLINISPTPKDPVSGNNFKYATNFDNKYFQVAGTQEKPVAEKGIIQQSYANTRQAKVLGNYNGLLKKENKLYNLPSLLYTGSGYLISNETYFIVDKGQNIPYKITSTDPDNSIATSVILSQLTGTSSVVLTGVTLPSTPGELKTNINSVVQILGYPGDKIGQESFGTPYFTDKGGTSQTQSGSTNTCGGTVSALGENYTTQLINGKCWTTQLMRHGTGLANGNTMPSDINTIEKWCPMPNGTTQFESQNHSNCNIEGGLYSWSETMGFSGTCNSTTCSQGEDFTKSVCGKLGTGWRLPSRGEYNGLISAGATGWGGGGNKILGILSSLNNLPGNRTRGGFTNKNQYIYLWTINYPVFDLEAAYAISLNIWGSFIGNDTNNDYYYKDFGYSVICVKD